MVSRPMIEEDTARAIIHCDGCILAMRLPDRSFAFVPGGRIEPGELPVQALARELKEELPDYECRILKELGVIHHYWQEGGVEHLCHHRYFAVESSNAALSSPPPSVEPPLEYLWIPLEQMEDRRLKPPSLPALIRRWQQGNPTPWSAVDKE